MELLCSAGAVLLLGKLGTNDGYQQVVLREDNNMACLEVNTGVANSPAMRFSLHMFLQTCREAKIKCLVLYMGTKENLIADLASRLEIDKATDPVPRAGNHNGKTYLASGTNRSCNSKTRNVCFTTSNTKGN